MKRRKRHHRFKSRVPDKKKSTMKLAHKLYFQVFDLGEILSIGDMVEH